MRVVHGSVVVLALASCIGARSGFATGPSSSQRDDGCVSDIVCTPGGDASGELVALVGVASVVSAATLWQFLR